MNDMAGDIDPTARTVAYLRSLEGQRSDPLFSDDLSGLLLAASGTPAPPLDISDATGRRLQASVAARTKGIDDWLLTSPNRQVVCLGAGLDARPWRLDLPDTGWFDVDHNAAGAFKAHQLREQQPTVRSYRQVTADLLDDFEARLAGAGFDASEPTDWVLEGVTMYLTEAQNAKVLEAVAAQSVSGSRLVTVGFGAGSRAEAQTNEMNQAIEHVRDGAFRSVIENPALWLRPHWALREALDFQALAARYGRTIEYSDDHTGVVAWFISAVLAS